MLNFSTSLTNRIVAPDVGEYLNKRHKSPTDSVKRRFFGSVAKFLNDRAGSVILNLFMKLTNRIAAPDVIGHCPSIDLCGSCA